MKNREERQLTARKSLLLASSNERLCSHVRESCLKEQWQFAQVEGGAAALFVLEQNRHDLLLLDLALRDIDVHEVIRTAKLLSPASAILVIDPQSCQFDFDKATPRDGLSVEQARLVGAINTVRKPKPVLLGPEPEASAEEAAEELLPGMVGRSTALRQVSKLVKMVAGRSTTVILLGESGTGKDLVAKAIHKLSPRAERPFVVVNCAAIPEALFESELFGYNRGAFTGAVESRLGRIHAAHGGTLFLDEIGELPLTMQAKLLRFLQEGEVQRLGSHDVFRVDVRVVAATNSDLLGLVCRRQFREDLFYRLMVFPVEIDPLRERVEDIGPLAALFLARLAEESGEPQKALSGEALNILLANDWRGNVRELQHTIERAVTLAYDSRTILPEHLRLLPSTRGFDRRPLEAEELYARHADGSRDKPDVIYN